LEAVKSSSNCCIHTFTPDIPNNEAPQKQASTASASIPDQKLAMLIFAKIELNFKSLFKNILEEITNVT
jgi:hypothetical protein